MPEPNTVTPGEPDRSSDGTVGWVQPQTLASAEPGVGETLTRTVASTPGPGDPARHTQAEDTERLSPADGSTRLPDIAGYRVEKILGRGGMGVVYRAVDLTLNRVVALKVLHPGGRDYQHVLGRFDREVKALAEIDHPNIVRIYHAGDWHGFPYFTMQFVPGGPLSHHLGRFTGDPRACASLAARVARAVHELHQHKVIHRDLKPLNILIGDNDEPLVADFGLAKWLDDTDSDYSLTGHPIGTRQYMAPEQTLGNRSEYSAACDVWAIGILLYELLAGRRPFSDDGKSDVLKHIREAPTPSLPADISTDLAAIIEKCLAKTPADRYPTAAELADDLDRWLAGEPVSVRPQRRTNRWALVTALVALMAIIALPALGMLGGDHHPPGKKSIADRIRDGETVFVTDGRGRPTRTPVAIAHQRLSTGTNDDGLFYFTSQGPGMARLIDKPLPLPVRVECDLSIPYADDGLPREGGLFVAEKTWQTGPVIHYSAIRCTIASAPGEDARFARPLKSTIGLHRRQQDRNLGTSAFFPSRFTDWGGKPGKDEKRRRVPVVVVVGPKEIRATIDGQAYPPLTATTVQKRLRDEVRGDPRLGDFPFDPPVFGDGLGITLTNTELIVQNLRITRSVP